MYDNILITGGAGFIGINAARFFLKKRYNIIIIDNFSRSGTKQNVKNLLKENFLKKKITVVKLDLRNSVRLNKVIKKYKPQLILHLAGQVAVTTSIINPFDDFDINIKGTLNLLESCRNNSKKSLIIYSSTNKVYGKIDNFSKTGKLRYIVNKKNITSEKTNLDFFSPYGCSKGSADQYVRDYSRIYGLNTVVLRQSCIYGRNQFGIEDQGWVAWFIIASLVEKKLTIYGNGKQVRDLLFVDDLTELFYRIYKNKKKCSGEIFNIGGGIKNTLSLLELVQILKKEYGLKIKMSFGSERDGDQKIFVSDNSKIKKYVNWHPSTNIKNGLAKIVSWSKENLSLIKKTLK
jgi:CDP-paratose 2-epimerase